MRIRGLPWRVPRQERRLPLPLLLAAAALLLAACDPSRNHPQPPEGAVTPTVPVSARPTAEASEQPSRQAKTVLVEATPAARAAAPPDLATEAGDWAVANGGDRNTRARSEGIASENVDQLELAWSLPIAAAGPYGAAAGAPVIADGVVYLQTLTSDVYAVDVVTGVQRWQRRYGIPVSGPNGPAVADGRVFVAIGGGGFEALDASAGETLWSLELEKDAFQPSVSGDTVYIGTGNLALVGGNSGIFRAVDAATGELRWDFQVIAEGFWGNPTLNSGGGVWYPPAIDGERGLVLFGTGNAGPYPGTRDFPNGSSRPGANLYTSSLVALEVETGELHWFHQVVPHGLFDHDVQLSPVLADTSIDGRPRSLVLISGKVGRVLALDLDSYRVVWDTSVGLHQNDELTEIPRGEVVEVYPGIFGGVETPLAVANDLVFVPVVNAATRHSATGHGAADGSSALVNASANTSLSRGTGEFVALDLATGEPVWQREFDSPLFGGATAVGDLVFTATFDGIIYALRQSDGSEVWRFDAGGGINAWPAVDGDTIVWPIGLGRQPRLIALRVGEAP